MRILKVTNGNMRKVADVASYDAARRYLAEMGKIVAFDMDTAIGGADALVIPHGARVADQYAVSI